MEFDKKNELFTEIHNALEASLRPATPDEHHFVFEVAGLASAAAKKHLQELLEENTNLKETIHKLVGRDAVDTGADVS